MKFFGKRKNGFRTQRFSKFDPISNPIASSLLAFEDDPNGGGGASGGEPEPKIFVWKDPEGKEFKLPDTPEIREAIGKSSSWGRKEAARKYEKELEELKALASNKDATLEDLNEKLRKIEEAGLSDIEKVKKQRERETLETQKKIQELQESTKNWESRYNKHKIETDIYSALSKHDLNNAAQTMMLLTTIGAAKVVKDEKTGEFVTMLDAKKLGLPDEVTNGIMEGELSPKEAVDKFLALPENAHHLKNNLRPGGGTSQTGGHKKADGTIVYTRSQIASDPKARAEYNKKLLSHEPVELLDN